MKRKAIAQIPYRKAAPAAGEYTFVAVQHVAEIAGEEHLFVEIYENDKKSMITPKIRLVYTKQDWGIYYAAQDRWSTGSIWDEYGRNVWERPDYRTERKTFMSTEDQDAVWDWCGEPHMSRQYHDWTERLEVLENSIKHTRWKKRIDNRKKRLDERIRNTPELPEDLESWAEERLFWGTSFLYYKRNGRYVDVCCSRCGGVTTEAVKSRDSYEGQFERAIETPRNGMHGKCPMCGTYGTWKAEGKARGVYGMKAHFFIGQPYKENGAVIRCLCAEKIFQLEEQDYGNGTEMKGAKESFVITETARRYFEEGKKTQTDYRKYSSYSGEVFWDDCNEAYGGTHIQPGKIYTDTFRLLEKTELRYSAAETFWKKQGDFNLFDYMERYREFPQIEMLVKMGLTGVVMRMINGYCGVVERQNAKKPEDFLGIRKEQLKLLIRKGGNTEYLDAMKKELRMGQRWDERDTEFVVVSGASEENLRHALEYMSMTQLINRVEKYSGVKVTWETPMCGKAEGVLKTISGMYFDYLNMRTERGYDLHNTVFLFPKNLQMAHDLMVTEINESKNEKREQEAEKKYPNIRAQYRKLRSLYFFENEDFFIRPARSAAEIIREGRTLHHCVGGDRYLKSHDEGGSIILFLREKHMPDTPYITVEIRGTQIQQWYGAYDKKPDRDHMQKWMDDYVEKLNPQSLTDWANTGAVRQILQTAT